MSTPVLHLVVGPNGAGKSTFVREVLGPVTQLPFINADEIAELRWPGEAESHGYEAAAAAAALRADEIAAGRSFITETVFSHPSKVELIGQAMRAGYLVYLHVILVPEELAVARVAHRVALGGHTVPEQKIRERYRRLWALVAIARGLADRVMLYDNTVVRAFVLVATYERGLVIGRPSWPRWTPAELCG